MTRKRILIVEDEKITALEMAEHLRQHGYEPLGPCASGEEAVASAYTLHPDAILMDIALKGPMDGIEAAEAIRSTCPCPVIYVTALSDQATLDRAKVTEPFGYVRKPVNERELHIAIEIALHRAKLEEKLRESEERYRTAIESSNDGVVIAREGRYVYVNERFLDLFGYDGPEEVLGTSIGDARHIHPEDREKVAERVRRRQAGEATPARYDYRAIHKDGRELHMEASAASIVYQGEPALLSYLRDITERKKAELRLRDSEEAMKSLLNATNDVALLMDQEGTIIAANTVLAQHLGREVDDLIGRNMVDLLPEEVARSRWLWAKKAIESGRSVRFEDASADNRYFDSCMYPVLDGAGKVVRLAVYAKDITEAKRAGRELAESEARFKQLFDSMDDGISLRDARTSELLDGNRRFCEMYGYTLEELKALPRGVLAANESAEERRKRLDAHYGQVAEGGSRRFPLEARRKDGSTLWVEMNVERLTIGAVDCLLTISRDITEHRKARTALKESEARFKQLFDSVNDGITLRDAETYELLDANRRFCEMYGYTLEELKTLPLGSLAGNESPDERRRRLRAYYAEVAEGVSRLFEAEGKRKDGSTFWVEVNVRRITIGGRECVLSVARDITERKQAEEAMKRSEEAALRLAQETGVIAEVGRIISSSLDIEEVYERFADEVRKLIPFDRIIINLVNQQEGVIISTYTAGMEALGREKGVVFPIAGSVTEEMMRTGTPMLFRLEPNEEVLDRFPGLMLGFQAGLRSRLSVPLISRGEVIGSLALASKQEKVYGKRDIRLAQGVAGQIAGAVANAQLFTERKQAEEKIRASLKEKEVLLKEIHHRVKNNLQIVSSLLFLQETRTEHPVAAAVLKESRNRVKSMALIHERLYQSPNLGSVDMGKYTRNLVSDLRRSYGAENSLVRLTVTVEDITLGITEAIPCGLIINELVSNALKHAFPKGRGFHGVACENLSSEHGEPGTRLRVREAHTALPGEGATRVPVVAGELTIQLVRGNTNQITLCVSDNGIGFPEHVDFRQSPSLGLTLINSLVEQLNGTIELDRSKGTTFTITFNVSG